MAGQNIGSVSVSVVPSAVGFTDKLKSTLLPEMDALGAEIGEHLNEGIQEALRDITIGAHVNLDDSTAKAILDELGARTVNPRVSLEDGDFGAQIDRDSGRLDDIGGRDARPRLTLDDSSFNRQLDEDMAKLDAAGSAGAGLSVPGGWMTGLAGLGAAASPALPGILTGAGAAVGALGLAFAGVSGAVSAYSTEQDKASTATKKTGSAAADSAGQITAAQAAVASATQQAANAQISAEEQLKTAQYSEQQAQLSLTAARQQAILTLQQLHDAEADTTLSAEQAQLDLEQAKVNAEQTDKSSTATALQKQQADLSVAEAQQRLKEAIESKTNAAKSSADADKKGVDGSAAVQDAEHKLAQAHQGVADAQRNVTQVQLSSAASVASAQHTLADAYASAAKGASGGTAAVNQYAAALAKLAPGGREMVQDIIGLEGVLHTLEGISENAIAPGFTTFVQGIHTLLPEISGEIRAMGGIISGFLGDMGKAFETSGFQAELKSLFAEGNEFVKAIGPALGGVASAFLELGAKSGPAVAGMTKGLDAILGGVADLFKNLQPYSKQIGDFFADIGKAIGAFGGPLGKTIGIVVSALDPLLDATLPLLRSALGTIAPVLQPLADALVPLLVTGLKALQPLFGTFSGVLEILAPQLARLAEPLVKFTDTLITDLAPYLPEVVILLGRLASDVMSGLGRELVTLLPALLTMADGVFKALAPILPTVASAFERIGATLGGQMGVALIACAPALESIAGSVAQILIAVTPLIPPLATLTVKLIEFSVKAAAPVARVIADVAGALAGVAQGIADAITWILKIDGKLLDWNNDVKVAKQWLSDLGQFFAASWSDMWGTVSSVVTKIGSFLSGSWDKFTADLKGAWHGIESFFSGTWNTIYNGTSSAIGKMGSFMHGSWTKFVSDLNSVFVAPFKSAFQGAWNWVVSNVFTPMHNFFTGTIPGWFTTLANAIGRAWTGFEGIVKKPVADVVDNVFGKLVNIFDSITGALNIGVHIPPVPHMAAGGKVTQGTTSTADDVLALISKGETVVSAAHSQALAPVFAAVGVPGYAAGGVPNPSGESPAEMGRFGPVPGVGGVVSSLKQEIGSLAGSALDAAVKHVLSPLVNAIPAGSDLGQMLKGMAEKAVDGIADVFKSTHTVVGGGSGGAPSGPLSHAVGSLPANYSAIVSYLVGHGFTKAEAAGIGGNIFVESGGNPDIWEASGGGGYGLIQWTPPPAGLVGSGLSGELAQIAREGTGMFSSPKSPAAAALQYLYGRERPLDPGATAATRETSANAIAKAMNWKFDDGGWLPPGLTLTANMTGRPEPVFSPQQWDTLSRGTTGGDGGTVRLHPRQFNNLVQALKDNASATSAGVGHQINGAAHGAATRGRFRTR